ncbi:class II glutamine amidotransferase [Thauera sp. Sel9]|uniref:class II glutamine amidotransferase n=1 Tax=Thauera sp. Sel9 TaxID=2974299 RepID=UPI0021E13491|nr:class II glutamine amidotransferase [Thauera sp. Sel9]MCV2217096.1 class II glutamine amidotransferase [Thauera sp. Sel9]
MCQLLGMNSNKLASVQFSLEGFIRRGGETDEHRDGWGIAYFEGNAHQLLHDPLPASISPLAETMRRLPVRSRNIIAHIRKATQGAVELANCHPFVRELWGSSWVFAHNGNLAAHELPLQGRFSPVGTTDSEHAFCFMLQELERRFGMRQPNIEALHEALEELNRQIAALGSFNYLLSCGQGLFAHCSTSLYHVERAYPFAQASLIDCDLRVDFGRLNHLDDSICVVATKPLTTDERWIAFEAGELRYFRGGSFAPGGRLQQRLNLAI